MPIVINWNPCDDLEQMMHPEVFGLAPAMVLYNAHAALTGQPQGPEGDDAAWDWFLDASSRTAFLAALSPCPRPAAEEALLENLLRTWIRMDPFRVQPNEDGFLEDQADRTLQQRRPALQDLVEVMDWSAHPSRYENGPSLAYGVLDEAMSCGTFDVAFPLIFPHLAPTDQHLERSLLSSALVEAEMGNPHAQCIRTALHDHTAPEIVGAHLIWAVINNNFPRYHALVDNRAWPLPVAALHARQADGKQALLRSQLNRVLEGPADPNDPETVATPLWHAWFEACQDLPGAVPRVRWLMEHDPQTQRPHWSAWARGELAPPSELESLGWAEVAAQVAFRQADRDPTVLWGVLADWGSAPYKSTQTALLRSVVSQLTHRIPRQFTWTPQVSLTEDAAQRHALFVAIHDHLDLAQVPGLAFDLLNHAIQWPEEFAARKTACMASLSPTDQDEQNNLFRTALCQERFWSTRSELPVVSDLVPAAWVGLALVDHLAQGLPLSLLFGEPLQWPLPVADLLALHTRQPALNMIRGPLFNRGDFYRGLERALENPAYPDRLRQALFEACRPLRPEVAEDRFRADDRLRALSVSPPSSPRPRPRS